MANSLSLNQRAWTLCDEMDARTEQLAIAVRTAASGTRLFDCGIEAEGSREAGLMLARVCMADLGEISISPEEPWTKVSVQTSEPVAACMASQYAGWEIKGHDYFAMGSGPMRAAAAREPLFADIGFRETAEHCVGVLESSQLPPDEVCRDIADKCGVAPECLTLLVAPTSSMAGTLQVVARSVETALHKLHELGFDLSRIETGTGSAPLPPVAGNDFAAIGLTNDAILYGGEVSLAVRGDDATIQALGPRVPSSASADFGVPFSQVLAKYNNDFYQIDPLLFSAAVVRFENLDTGTVHRFGEVEQDILSRSFSSHT